MSEPYRVIISLPDNDGVVTFDFECDDYEQALTKAIRTLDYNPKIFNSITIKLMVDNNG